MASAPGYPGRVTAHDDQDVAQTAPASWDSARYLREILRAPVYEAAEHTPLQHMPALSARLGCTVEVKREDLQSVHSFKIRGAYNAMRALPPAARARGVVTASAGNHAQGVARSAALLGVDAVIVMPTVTPQIKVDAVRALGGTVLLHGDNFDAAAAEATRLAEAEGRTYIAPFDDPLVIAGQGTIGLEMIQQDARLDRVFVPVGGGGLVSGIAVLIKALMPQVRVIGVERGVGVPDGGARGRGAGHPGAGGPVRRGCGGQAHRAGDLPSGARAA